MRRRRHIVHPLLWVIAYLLAFTACGGGGGGDSSTNPQSDSNNHDTTPQRQSDICAYFVTSIETDLDAGADGIIDGYETWGYAYDDDGNRTLTSLQLDRDGDGVVEKRITDIRAYDSEGKITGVEYDSQDLDRSERSFKRKADYTYDDMGRVKSIVYTISFPNDDQYNSGSRETFTYTDDSYHFTSKLTEIDDDGNGEYEHGFTETISYDISATQATVTIENDEYQFDPNAPELLMATTYQYDPDGQLVIETTEEITRAGELISTNSSTTYRYNSGGWYELVTRSQYSHQQQSFAYDWETMTVTRTIDDLDSAGKLRDKQTADLIYDAYICSDNLANPMDSAQKLVGTTHYKLRW